MRILNIEPENTAFRLHHEIVFHVPHRHPWRP